MVDFVLISERERDPDKLEQLGPLLDEPHLVQPHIGCDPLQTSELRVQVPRSQFNMAGNTKICVFFRVP